MSAGPLILAVGVGFLCIVALAGTKGSLPVRACRIGPFLLVPPVILWGVIAGSTSTGENRDLWRLLPMYAMLALAVLWHVALIAVEKEGTFYLRYALVHLPIFYLFWGLFAAIAINFPLQPARGTLRHRNQAHLER